MSLDIIPTTMVKYNPQKKCGTAAPIAGAHYAGHHNGLPTRV